jgi:hypothetical protein
MVMMSAQTLLSHRTLSLLIGGLLLTSLPISPVAAGPSNTTTPTDGVSENESATLWSRDDDSYVNQSTYQRLTDENRTLAQQYANGTDFSFKRPPDTAARWTRHDFDSLDAGDRNTAVHPPHAALQNGSFIKDAHATIFSVHPSTRGHLTPNRTPLFIAPNGTIRGFVDYRVLLPTSSGESSVVWQLQEHRIETIRLKQDGKTIATTAESHTPSIDYRLDPRRGGRLTLEAEIFVQVQLSTPNGISYRNETLTVSDTTRVQPYNLSASASYATYPDDDCGVAVFQTRPWQGYTLTPNESGRVRGVWRFYTARDRSWETLLKANSTGRIETTSDSVPVYVHAYPSSIGPRTAPIRNGPDLIETWGSTHPSPEDTVGKNVHVDVVNAPYSTSYGVAIRHQNTFNAIRIAGIVRGINTTVATPPQNATRQLRRSSLSIDILRHSSSRAVIRIELRDAETGKPIDLSADGNHSSSTGMDRQGYITIADQRVATNSSGLAVVSIDRPGIVTARYHPGPWITHEPAYVSDTATVRWHPLGTSDDWFTLFTNAVWRSVPFLLVFCAGHRLLIMLGFRSTSRRSR